MKVLIRGGSIPAGQGVSRSYVDILREDPGLTRFQFINRSRFRETTFDGIWSFDEDIRPFAPDILILHFGVDDAYFPVYRSEFKENLVQMTRLVRKLFRSEIILLTSHPFEDPYESEVINIYYRVIREVSVDLGCEMIPVHTYWQGYLLEENKKTRDLVQDDSRYPNEAGHAVYAQAVAKRLERF